MRWLFSPEELPAPPDGRQRATPRMRSYVRWSLSGDELETERLDAAGAVRPRRILRWVLSPEGLPSPPGKPPQAGGDSRRFWSWLFSAEELPHDELAASMELPRAGFLRWLLASEACARVPTPSTPRRAGFLRWLLSSKEW